MLRWLCEELDPLIFKGDHVNGLGSFIIWSIGNCIVIQMKLYKSNTLLVFCPEVFAVV